MNKSEKLPLFFNYKEEDTDNGYETIQDFYLSWMLRCAEDKYKDQNSKLHEYARHTVFLLIYGDNDKDDKDIYKVKKENMELYDDFLVLNVKTKRQFKKIDLIAELDIQDKSGEKKYVLNIEDKWYSKPSDYQLTNSIKVTRKEYGNNETIFIDLVIFGDYEIIKNQEVKQICKDNGFRFLTICDIKEEFKMSKKEAVTTGNALFDEYWFNF